MTDRLTRAKEVLNLEIEGLASVRDLLGDAFERAIDLMLEALDGCHKIVVTGVGKNLHIAQKLSATLASTGSTSVVLNPTQAVHGDLGILTEGDVLLALSYSGESEELVQLIPMVRRLKVNIVALAGVPGSTLETQSDVCVPVTVAREACPFNMAPTTSTTATLAMGDALAMVLLEARGFEKKDYATLHPGGAIGRALLMRVSDIMRAGDQLAAVAKSSTVRDAIVAMSKARAGSAGVVDEDSRLVGIFTDGDLRRHLTDDGNVLDLTIESVMTPSPITVEASQLAVDVMCIYEDHNIDDLPVVDTNGRLVGIIDIQDLPRFKIM